MRALAVLAAIGVASCVTGPSEPAPPAPAGVLKAEQGVGARPSDWERVVEGKGGDIGVTGVQTCALPISDGGELHPDSSAAESGIACRRASAGGRDAGSGRAGGDRRGVLRHRAFGARPPGAGGAAERRAGGGGAAERLGESRGGEGWRYWRDWSSDVCSSDLRWWRAASGLLGGGKWDSMPPSFSGRT